MWALCLLIHEESKQGNKIITEKSVFNLYLLLYQLYYVLLIVIIHPAVSWVSQLVRIASSSCLSSNSESEWNFVVVIFRWRVSCAHQTADWTTCTRSYKNWRLTSWWKEGKKTKVCKKNTQLLEAPFLSELPLCAYRDSFECWRPKPVRNSCVWTACQCALQKSWFHCWLCEAGGSTSDPGVHQDLVVVAAWFSSFQICASHNRSMFVGAFKQAVFFRSKEGWFG